MICLSRAVVVEGKYDRATLASVIDAPILETDGFGIFRDKQCRALIRRYATTCGIIVLTDSDSAGRLIRGHIKSIAGEGADVVHLYIPKIAGKERRKKTAGKEGLLGVEGMKRETLEELFFAYRVSEKTKKAPITQTDLYEWGLFGGQDASSRRRQVLSKLGLPEDLSVKALLDAVNFLHGKEAFVAACEECFQCEKNE